MSNILTFINVTNEKNLLALFITILIIWSIAILTLIKARSLRKDERAVISEYDPPKGTSPVFARFLMVSGKMGGMSGEVSQTGSQLLTLINLFEDGLLKKLVMIDESTVDYEIHENYMNLPCAEEEKMFLARLGKNIGMSGRLQENQNPKNTTTNGFENLNSLWGNFWYDDLTKLALSRGYMKKESKGALILSIFAVSITFGVFVSIFLFFIPIIGPFIGIIPLIPVIAIFGISYGIATGILSVFDISWITHDLTSFVVITFGGISWFIWFLIFGQSMSKINRALTPAGLEVVRQLNGYKMYLATVDKDRISFTFNRESDLSRNRTSFSWLGVFGMLKDIHWDQWYKIAELGQSKAPN
ncbi:MAG: DUF2207 domain-containing protein [bacterium]|nr:DUF2207 domain-containing protein [bacterium]